ncbi:unnamed protein product [Amoebophrya sp. A25]|nr:unnamed protein product [Amoebophrya sp. A25]|eukprot:GSA25T00017579001.1
MKWVEALREARQALGLGNRMVPVGGKTDEGQMLLREARRIYDESMEGRADFQIVIPRKKPDKECPWRPPRPREKLIDVRYYVDSGKGSVPVSENPSWYPGVSFKNGNTFKQIRANKEPRDLDSWCVCWATRDSDGKPERNARHFFVGEFYTREDQEYENAKRRARQFAIEFRKQKVREFDQMIREQDRANFERLKALDKLELYRPPRNRVAARQSGRQGVTWMSTTQSWQVQMRCWDAALKKSRVMKQCHVKINLTGLGARDEARIEEAVDRARRLAIRIRKGWEDRYRVYTIKHYAKFPKYDENGRLIEDEPDEEEPTEDQYGNPIDPADFLDVVAEGSEIQDEGDEGEVLEEELDGLEDDEDAEMEDVERN